LWIWLTVLALLIAAPGAAVTIPAQQEIDESLVMDPASQMRAPGAVDEQEVGHSRPAPPPLPGVSEPPPPRPTPTAELRPAPGMAPPRISPCYTSEEYSRAGMGTGCSCTCDEYARLSTKALPEQRRCNIACGVAYYRCWAPPPTEADIAAKVRDIGAPGPVLLAQPDGRAIITSGIMMERAVVWEEAQRCRAG